MCKKMGYLKEMYGLRSKDFCEGMIEGFKTYAHWLEGVQYVGTTGKTLKKAIKEVEEIKGYREASQKEDKRRSYQIYKRYAAYCESMCDTGNNPLSFEEWENGAIR